MTKIGEIIEHDSLSLHDVDVLTDRDQHLLGVSFVRSLNSNLCTGLTTQKTKENNYITSHTQNTTALQPNIFSTAVYRLVVTHKGRFAFYSANHCQGQLKTPQLEK